MQRDRVDSSVIATIGYSPDDCVLEVEFHSGRVYQYFDIPVEEYEKLMTASSIGRYFNRKIRDEYRRQEVPPESHYG